MKCSMCRSDTAAWAVPLGVVTRVVCILCSLQHDLLTRFDCYRLSHPPRKERTTQ